jgi:hypothetical protein
MIVLACVEAIAGTGEVSSGVVGVNASEVVSGGGDLSIYNEATGSTDTAGAEEILAAEESGLEDEFCGLKGSKEWEGVNGSVSADFDLAGAIGAEAAFIGGNNMLVFRRGDVEEALL